MILKKASAIEDLSSARNYIRKVIRFLFIATGIINILIFFTSIYSYYIIEKIFKTKDLYVAIAPTVSIAMVYMISYAITAKRLAILIKLSKFFDYMFFEYILRLGIVTNARVSSLVAGKKIIQDFNTVKNFISSRSNIIYFLEMPWSLILVVVLFFVFPANAIICLLAIAVLLLIAIYQYKSHVSFQDEIIKLNDFVINQDLFDKVFENYSTIKAMDLYSNIASKAIYNDKKNYEKILPFELHHNSITHISKLIKSLFQVGLFLNAALGYISGHLTIGAFIFVTLIVNRTLWPFENISIYSIMRARICFKKMIAAISEIENIAKINIGHVASKNVMNMFNVSYSYPNSNSFAIRNIAFQVSKAEIAVVIGGDSSGKSTLLKVAANLLSPSSGHISFNNPDNITSQFIGYCSEDVKFLSGTIRDNISSFDQSVCLDQIIDAAKLVFVHDKITAMPQGYNSRLSDGQYSASFRKRIGLCSAIVRKPKLLILDDPFATFDSNNNMKFAKFLLDLKATGTAILLTTNNREIFEIADKAILLKNGEIMFISSPKDMIAELAKLTEE
jgi:ABC-type protease/lipase transport system fused ATPase/permease subunit